MMVESATFNSVPRRPPSGQTPYKGSREWDKLGWLQAGQAKDLP